VSSSFRATLGLVLPALALTACADLQGLAQAPATAVDAEALAGKKPPAIVTKPAIVDALADYLKGLPPTISADDAKVTQTADTWVLEQTYHIKDRDPANLKLNWQVTGGGTWQTGTPPAAPADATYKFGGAWVKLDQSNQLAPKITITVPRKAGVVSSGKANIVLTATNNRGKGSKLDYNYSVSFSAEGRPTTGWGGSIVPVDGVATLPENLRIETQPPAIVTFLKDLAPTISPTDYKLADAADAITQAHTYVIKDLAPATVKLDWKVTGTNTWKTGTPPAAPADATYKLTGAWAKLDSSQALSPRLTITYPHKAGVQANGSVQVELTATNANNKATKLAYEYITNYDGTQPASSGYGGGVGPLP
jgi:hypothetical protein